MGSRLENKSTEVRKRIETHNFSDEAGEEYEPSKFGGFSDYFRRKKIKLQNLDADLRARSGDKPQIFRGIVANVNGYTQPSLNDLHEMIVSHGGGFIQYLDGKTMVTHIVASSLTPKKVVEFRRYRIVKPAWIVDSVAAGKLLPWNDYRVVDEGAGQKILGIANGQVVSEVNNQVKGYRDQTDRSWYTSQLNKSALESHERTSDTQPEPPQQSLTQSGNLSFDADDVARLDAAVAGRSRLTGDSEEPAAISASSPAELAIDRSSPVPAAEVRDRSQVTAADGVSPNSLKRQNSSHDDAPRKAAKLTAEEHNSILLADPRIWKSSVVNPDFLEQYYRESRLHHLSTWKADLKSQLKALTEEKTSSQKLKQKRPTGARRYILHVDFDSFFVAVSLKKCPQYKDRPCVVAHGSGSGSEIASCNYPARKFGVSNGMWMKKAQELCKDLEVLPYDFPAYEEASRKFYDAILATGGIVQSVSIDEALVDVSALCIAVSGTDGVQRNEGGAHREQAQADEIAKQLRAKVLEETGCNVSVGIGGNILLAKVALRKAKPAGQFHLRPESVLSFIGELEVQDLPGVAWSLGGKLEELGIKFVKDIRECTKEKLTNKLGPKTGEKLWDYSRGIDRVEVGDVVTRKSVSAEVNWGVRFENQEQVDEFIENLCTELQKRLIKERVKGRQLTLKIMRRAADAPLDPPKHLGHGKCDTYNKSVQLGVCTNDAKIISKETLAIMRGFGFSPGELRGIGVQMQKLEPIKGEGPADGSQRRLQFKLGGGNTAGKSKETQARSRPDEGSDEIETPKTIRFIDPSAAGAVDLQPDSPSKKPLNVQGTQFVMPTQVDPDVLRELPEDIRSRLLRGTTAAKHTAAETSESEDQSDYHTESRASRRSSSAVDLPNQSQLDADTLAALPDDVRAEVLALYKTRDSTSKNQLVLPQSPRKSRVLPASKIIKTTRNRGGAKNSIFARSNKGASTLTQSNFVSRPPSLAAQTNESANDTDTEPAELDPAFLAALPPDLQAEVLHNHRQARLRHKSGIDTTLHSRPRASRSTKRPTPAAGIASAADVSGAAARVFRLPARQPRPTFTKAKLSTLPDIRAMLRDWTRAFWDEPPFDEDVAALAAYLGAVVRDEGDMAKAQGAVRWLVWLVEEDSGERWGGDEMRIRWEGVVERVRDAVREAVKARGLGAVEF